MDKILVIEDEKRVADLLSRGLSELGYEVSVSYDGDMGLRLLRSNEYDLIICDVILPGKNGFEVCKSIRQLNAAIPVLMLTALGTIDDKLEGFDAGADDYMTKPFDLRELDARTRILLKRSAAGTQNPTKEIYYSDIKINLLNNAVYRDGKEIKLSPKEFNLLVYMVQNAERILSRVEIAEKVWDTHFDTGTNFIDVYINYLRKKIDKDFGNKLIHTKPGMGFILSDYNENKE